MALDPRLLEILACPDDKGPLYYFAAAPDAPEQAADGFLFCPTCRRRYEVRDDIPVMLIEEATVLSEEEAEALVERARTEGVQPTFISGDTPGPPGTA